MFKMLLASTALTALVTTSALAASHTATTTDTNAATTESTMTADQAGMIDPRASLASDLIGSAVYGSANEDADMIGDINDIVINPEGEVASVIVGVGGFLGIGEKDVAVEYSTIKWVDRDGDRWIVANMTREQLEAAPAFDRSTIYTEARSDDKSMDTAQTAPTTMDPAATAPAATDSAAADPAATAPEKNAENVQNGTSAVAPAEEKTTGLDRSSMTPVMAGDLSADNMIGRTVYGAGDENIGEVGDVLLSADNKVEGFVLDVGGFLGMGEKEVAISPEKLEILADADGELTIFTPFTEEQLKAQPEYSEETWKSDRESVIMVVPAG